jgi:polynucleotide 5'-kinase involved in rRNA processing
MKSLSQTLLKLALLKLTLFAVLVALGAAGNASAQNPRIQTSQLDALAAKASQTVDVNIDERLMQLAAKFLSSKDDDEAKVKEIVNGLKGIYVKSFEFENEGQYTESDLEGIRSQLRNTAWNRIVNVSSKKEGSVEVYLMQVGNQISGLAVLASDPKEITVVNIIGPVDLEKLTQLEGQFGIPDLDLEPHSKPKRKN